MPEPVTWPALPAVGLSLVLGGLLLIPTAPAFFKSGIFLVAADSVLITALVVGTGGPSSPFLSLYALAALEIVLVSSPAHRLFGSGAVLGGYLTAPVVTTGSVAALISAEVWTRAGVVLILCAAAALLGARIRDAREESERLSRDLSAEKSSGGADRSPAPELRGGAQGAWGSAGFFSGPPRRPATP